MYGLPSVHFTHAMANYKGGKQCDLLRNVKGQQKSQTIEVNNKHKLRMYYLYIYMYKLQFSFLFMAR